MPAAEFHLLWGGDNDAAVPRRRIDAPVAHATSRRIGGFRFGLFTVAAGRRRPEQAFFNAEEALADFEAKLPGLRALHGPDGPGMHTTDTIDFEVVLEGRSCSNSTTAPR